MCDKLDSIFEKKKKEEYFSMQTVFFYVDVTMVS